MLCLRNFSFTPLIVASLFFAGALCGQPNTQEPNKTMVFIIGAGRSGSSCLAGVLDIMGLPLGDNLIPRVYEDRDIWDFMKYVFDTLGMKRYQLKYIRNWDEQLAQGALHEAVKTYLKKRYKNMPLCGVNYPLISAVLPLFITCAQELGFTPKIIVLHRDIQDIASTFRHVEPDHYPTDAEVYHKIAVCFMSIVEHAAQKDVVSIHINDLLYNTEHAVNALHAFLPPLKPYDEIKDELRVFFENECYHRDF